MRIFNYVLRYRNENGQADVLDDSVSVKVSASTFWEAINKGQEHFEKLVAIDQQDKFRLSDINEVRL